jgi:hypothetical protein
MAMKFIGDSLKSGVVLLTISLIMAGCSSGGGTSASSTPRTGVFLDSAVEGLNYSTGSRSGITDAGGHFTYIEGETVTFKIGDVVIGQAAGKEQITPIDLAPGATDETHPKVTNICRLLQSLDSDGDPANGIAISQETREVVSDHPVNLNLSTVEFEINSNVDNLFDELSMSVFADQGGRGLCTIDQARKHFRQTLGTVEPGPQGPSLKTFGTAVELEAYLKEQYASAVLSASMYSGDLVEANQGGGEAGGGGSGDGGSGTGVPVASADTTGYSTTNVQEEGVDESDMVKTDGTCFYIAGNRKVTVVKAVPADSMTEVVAVDIGGTVDSIYLYSNILAVLYIPDNGAGQGWVEAAGAPGGAEILRVGMPYWIPVKAQVGVKLLNVSNPASPQLIKDIITDGWLVSSRLEEGRLHLIQQFLPDLPPLDLWYDGTETDRKSTLASNMVALKNLTLADLAPGVKVTNSQGNSSAATLLVTPDDFYYPDESGGGSIVTVTTVDLDEASYPYHSIGVVADAGIVYASTEALYLAASRRYFTVEPALVDVYGPTEETVIHKFDLTGDEVVSMGSGKVAGRLLNQFSMGEYQGVLRVATTSGYAWGGVPVSNSVFCLQAGDEGLDVIGKVENISQGEQLYSARFVGRRGFLVTFVNIDPLFTIDLSDPTAPTLVGELHIPGYSTYIHPLDENHLISIGKDAIPEGDFAWYQGVQLSMFDITNLADPKLMHKRVIGVRGTDSEALYNHKAFTYWSEEGLLAIPMDLYEYKTAQTHPSQYGERTFVGLYGYRVSLENGFEQIGRISTVDLQTYPYYYSSWMRGTFIGDYVYAIQQDGVSSAPIDNMSAVSRLVIDEPQQYTPWDMGGY